MSGEGGLGMLAQVFRCFCLSNKSRSKQAGKQRPVLEGNWAPEIVLSPCFLNVLYALKSLKDCVSDTLTAVWALIPIQIRGNQ